MLVELIKISTASVCVAILCVGCASKPEYASQAHVTKVLKFSSKLEKARIHNEYPVPTGPVATKAEPSMMPPGFNPADYKKRKIKK